VIKEDEMNRNVVRMGGMKNAYKILVGERKWERPLCR